VFDLFIPLGIVGVHGGYTGFGISRFSSWAAAFRTVHRRPNQNEALAHAVHNQRDRRNLTDADILRCVRGIIKDIISDPANSKSFGCEKAAFLICQWVAPSDSTTPMTWPSIWKTTNGPGYHEAARNKHSTTR
jgi:hypothetical protein